MGRFITKYRWIVIGILAIFIYFSLLTLVSFSQSGEVKAIGENLISNQSFLVYEEDEGKSWVDENGLYIRDFDSGIKVFSQIISLKDIQKLQVCFDVECPAYFSEGATLHVDLYTDGYDSEEQEFTVELKAGHNKVSQVIDKGENAPDEAQFRIFCMDPVQCGIHDISIHKAEAAYHEEMWICVAIIIFLVGSLLIVIIKSKQGVVSLRKNEIRNNNESLPITNKGFLHIDSYIKPLEGCFSLVLIIQLLMIAILNFTQIDQHIGYDASTSMLASVMVWDQKKIFLDHYIRTAEGSVDIKVILAAIFYGLTKDIFLSVAIRNVLSAGILILLIWKISRSLKFTNLTTLIIAVLIFIPYVTAEYTIANPLDYFSCMFFSSTFYLWRVITILASLLTYFYTEDSKQGINLTLLKIISSVLLFVSGMSIGISYLVYFTFPCVLGMVFFTYIYKGEVTNKRQIVWQIAIHTLCIILGIAIYIIKIDSGGVASSLKLISISKFIDNIESVFLGFGMLLGALPEGEGCRALSFNGINYLFRCFLFLELLGVLIHIIVRIVQRNIEINFKSALIASICFVNFVMYFFLPSPYGNFFEARYLIIFFVLFMYILGIYLESFEKHNLWRKMFAVTNLIIAIIISGSSYHYLNSRRTGLYAYLNSELAKYDEKIVYMHDENEVICRSMRAVDQTKVYKGITGDPVKVIPHWGDYTYFDDITDEVNGSLFIGSDEQYNAMGENVRERYTYEETLEYNGSKWNVYSSDSAIDLRAGLPEEKISYDFPSTAGTCITNCEMVDGECRTNGVEGYSMYGPYVPTQRGKYSFTLNYEVIKSTGNIPGSFDIAIDYGKTVLSKENISKKEREITLVVDLEENHVLEYRLYVNKGSVIQINSVKIERLNY